MKTSTQFKIIVGVLFCMGAAGAGLYLLMASQFPSNTSTNVAVDNLFGWKYPVTKFPSTGSGGNLAYSDIRDPGGIPQGLPVRLKIPIIGVDSAIEDALITPDGRMDVPAGSVHVAWFALGPHPGDEGSAVIGGHYGIQRGVPFVFYKLDQLKIGDKISIVDDKSETISFIVRRIKSFDRNADATTVFTSNDGLAHLNLITCEGVWNQVNGTYPQRLVIFTDLLSEKDTAVPLTFNRVLSVGSSGADVTALQNVLIQKGFLVMPPGVTKGVFGGLTRAGVAKYQTSVGLSSLGILGPLTRAKLNAELARAPVLPNAGSESSLPAPLTESAGWFQVLVEALEDSFVTPLDALITVVLLIAIVFLVFKIIRIKSL